MTDDSQDFYLEGEERFGPVFSLLYGAFGKILLKKYYQTVVDDLRNEDFHSLLDVGCGTGELLLKLAGIKGEAAFYCVDPSSSMINVATKKFKRNGLAGRVKFAGGSSRHIPFDEKFDAIISSFSYHHWKDRDESLNNLMGYVSNSGFIKIYEYDNDFGRVKNSHGVREKEWAGLELDGFRKEIEHKNGLIILKLVKEK
jgi:SAM-dependent methyltransferase